MDYEGSFKAVEDAIGRGDETAARSMVERIVDECGSDTSILLKCASILMVIGDRAGTDRILDLVMGSLPSRETDRLSVASVMRGMGRAEDSLAIMSEAGDGRDVVLERTRALHSMGRSEEAISELDKLHTSDGEARLLHAELLCSLGRTDDALSELDVLLEDEGPSYQTLVRKANVLISTGMRKEAVKFVNAHLKDDKRNADMLALKAYVMRVTGKTLAAINYSQKSLKAEPGHVGALETMAHCLVEKGKYAEAKILAGAIFQQDPGNPMVFQILDATCE